MYMIETFIDNQWQKYTWNNTEVGAKDVAEFIHTDGKCPVRIIHKGKIVFKKGDHT